MKVSKWGNSLAIRLPAEMIAEEGLQVGDDVVVKFVSKASAAEDARKIAFEAAWADLEKIRPHVNWPADYKFDRDEANGRN